MARQVEGLDVFLGWLIAAFLVIVASPPAGAGELDPCQLVTRDEVSRALGAVAGAGKVGSMSRRGAEIVGGSCTYRVENSPTDQVSVGFEAYPGLNVPKSFEMTCKRATVREMEGIGDGACAFVSPAGFVNLTARAGGALVRVNLSSRTAKDALASASDLGRAAARRFAGGEAVARVPGLEAFYGTWTLHPPSLSPRITGGAVGLINVRDQGFWSLIQSDARQGTLAAADGQWLFAAKDLRIQGAYTFDGDDAFATEGILRVRFDRIPCGRAPWLVDPDLLKGFGTPWRTLPKKPPIDPRLAGLWQGVGHLDGKPVVVLWYVLPEGDARQMILREREGRLDAEDGGLTFQPNLEQPAEGRYIVHAPETLEVTLPTGATVWKQRPRGPQGRPSPPALRGPCGTPGSSGFK